MLSEQVSVDYGYFDIYHQHIDGLYEKIMDYCNSKYGYGKYTIEGYDVDVTINATVKVLGE